MEVLIGKPINMERLNRTIEWRKKIRSSHIEQCKTYTFDKLRTQCPICKSMNYEHLTSINRFDYVTCSQCKHVFYLQILEKQDVKLIYDGETDYLQDITDMSIFNQRVEMIGKAKVEYVTKRLKKKKDDLWLDVGCGGCELLYAAKQAGWLVRGIEPCSSGVRQGQRLGIHIDQLYIQPQKAKDQNEISELQKLFRARVVSLFGVLEHIDDPVVFLKEITTFLSAGTTLVVGVPRTPSLSSLSIQFCPEKSTRYLVPPDHIHIFSENSLSQVLRSSDYHITHMWKFGQDFFELMSMFTEMSDKELHNWPKELFSAIVGIQEQIDKQGLSDSIIVIAEKNS